MRIDTLIRRGKRYAKNLQLTTAITTENVRNFAASKRLVAMSALGKTAGIMAIGVILPLQTLAVATPAEPQAAEIQTDQVESVKLVLDTKSINDMVKEPNRSELTVTMVESKAQEKARTTQEGATRITRVATTQVSAPAPTDVPFEQKRALAQSAAAAYGIDWKILEAVWQVESGKRYHTSVTSYAGAQGPMQFMPGTWRAYQVDGNGDGVADVHNAEDAVYGAAKLLAANGAAENVDRALLAYNHAQWYVDKVKTVAAGI